MKDAYLIISGIENKIRNLIEEHNALESKCNKLEQKEEKLTITVEQYKLTIKELEEKNSLLKVSKSLESMDDSDDVKKKITRLVREIDKCIGLLNR